MNKTFSDLDSIIQLSRDSDTLGFDLSTGQTWIYPTNYQVRDYQFNITQAALHNNTLVSLPTGLGKTFIAAVVMYNFYRWYPMGKIIFMAPTRPLVKQQQDACYNIMAIPPDATAEMTGNKVKASRGKIWKEKRVFFITPQILQNDIDVVLDLAQQIKCIVIDEAHKALGKHANCEAIKKIHKINQYFRVLALSATPGSNFNSVRDVITNLLISHIEVRTNESIDVVPYVFQRKLETFVIAITGQLLHVKNKYIMILDRYTRPLLQFNIFTGNCANLIKGRIVLTMKDFKERGRQHPKYSFILKHLNLCVTLYHGYELLIRHGLRGFLVFFDGTISKPLLNCIQELHGVLDDVRNYLGPLEDVGMLPDGTIPEVEGPVVYSHPKFKKLNDVLIDHFKTIEDGDTRVMVFCEYRESVMEIYQMLLRQRPLIKPRVFLGQGAISQAQQLQAIKQFKSGTCNTLISTCIGEEGLDVGEVDLIVCFDISSKSPIRMVQRMGRTGRKRDGRVVVLVTEGKEQQLLTDCLVQRNNMTSLLESQPIKQHLYTNNPKMIPDSIKPQCNKMYITIKEPEKFKKKEDPKKKTKVTKNSTTLKNMFENTSSQSSTTNTEEEQAFKPNKNEKTPAKVSRASKKLRTPSKNQMDLRSMFSKINSTQSTINSSQVCSQVLNDNNVEECSELSSLVTKIKSYLNMSIINKSGCKICDLSNNKFVCSTTNNRITTMKWKKPNLSILDSITAESLIKFSESITPLKNITFNVNKNESKNSNIIRFNHVSAKTSCANNSLQFFNLETTFEVFSDDSTEFEEYSIPDPIIFNNSIGNIYCTPVKTRNYKTEKLNETVNIEQNIIEKPISPETIESEDLFENEEDLIVSDIENLSPVLTTQRFVEYKRKIQRNIFSQSQQNNDRINNCTDEQKVLNKIKTCNKVLTEIQDIPVQEKASHSSKSNSGTVHIQKENGIPLKCAVISTSKVFNSSVINKLSMEVTNTNMSTPKYVKDSKNERNLDFWDESLFEMCDSDESLFEDDDSKSMSPKRVEKQNEITDKKLNESNENIDDSDGDSDATIILLNPDKIFEDIEQEKIRLQNEEQSTKPVSPSAIKSLCNKTIDSSLLSVTQAIDLLNDSQFKSLDSSLKMNENKTVEIDNTFLRNPILNNNLLKNGTIEENRTDLNNSISKSNIDPDNDRTSTTISKECNDTNNVELDDLEITDIFEDFDDDSEKEFSLLSLSQHKKRKLKQNQKKSEDSTIAKYARISIDKDEQNNSSKKPITDNKSQNVTKLVYDKTKKLDNEMEVNCLQTANVLKDKNSDHVVEENSLLNFAHNTKIMRNKKFKLTILKMDKNEDSTINKTTTQNNSVKLPQKTVTNTNKTVIVLSDSDDDFDVRPAIKPLSKLRTPVKKLKRINTLPSYNKLNENTNKSPKIKQKSRSQSFPTKTKDVHSRKKSAYVFIDDEAVVEYDEHYVSDSNSDKDSDEQSLDSSFVSYTQNVHDQTDMRAKYLQSIRSPKFKPGAFKMPYKPPAQIYDNVFSQVENNENETYMDDSFCVGNDQTLSQTETLSYLEIMEDQLEKERKEKRNKKRKRIITISDSD